MVAVAGEIVYVTLAEPPTVTVTLVGFKIIPVTSVPSFVGFVGVGVGVGVGVALAITVMLEVAVKPLFVVAVIIAVPLAIALTFPKLSTVATFVFELVHVTSLFSAFSGYTNAFSLVVFPTFILSILLSITTLVASTFLDNTVTLTSAFIPLLVVIVITTFPGAIPLAIPLLSTVKILSELEIKVYVYEYEPFRQYAKDMKEMADAGCWSRSALTNTVTDDDAFGALQGASIAWNASVFTYIRQAEQTDGVVGAAYDITKPHLVGCEAYSNNDMAITASSKNPERAAMILDIMKMDTYVNHLILLGEEGKHYTINENNEYTKVDGATENYPPMTVSASWAIKNGELSEAGGDAREKEISDSWEERVVSNPTITFVFDDTNVSNEKAAVNTVLNSYVPMLELGLVDDVDATLDKMIQECYDSGLQTVLDEFYSQYDAWLATR